MADEDSRNDTAVVDPRFQLANERTLLAWLRTTLGLLAGAVATASPVIDLPKPTRAVLGLLLLWRGGRDGVRRVAPLPGGGRRDDVRSTAA